MEKLTVLIGDNRETLRTLPDASVQCVVTSPPYYGLRDYGNDGQIGLESTPDEYVAALVDVFREVRRVLRDDGTVWLNLGDSYGATGGDIFTNLGGPKHAATGENAQSAGNAMKNMKTGLRPKNLLGIPWHVAFALQSDGWYLRQDIIWHKPNPMPESVTDRCTKAHEYLFLLSKLARYFYDAEAVKEANQNAGATDRGYKTDASIRPHNGSKSGAGIGGYRFGSVEAGRNRRSVWTIATQPYSGAHFATFPPKLIEPCILAGTPEKGCCPYCGSPWERVVERSPAPKELREKRGGYQDQPTAKHGWSGQEFSKWKAEHPDVTTGHRPTCSCPEHEPVPSTVLDPFGGSGTTAGVALKHKRRAILCELNPEYAALIDERVNSITDELRQYHMFDGGVGAGLD